jgi:hypothetical protein
MGLLFHLNSHPGCLEELGISQSSNWAELLGSPTLSSATVSLSINKHPIHVQPDLKLAAKHPKEYMWKEEDSAFPSMPDAPTKCFKHRPTATDGNKSSQITIEHCCVDENTSGTLLKNLMTDRLSLDASDSKNCFCGNTGTDTTDSILDGPQQQRTKFPRLIHGQGRSYW